MRAVYIVIIVRLAGAYDAEAQTSKTSAGYLFLAGGGIEDPRLVARFVELAGGSKARLVLVPTASSDQNQARPEARDHLRAFLLRHGAAHVEILHTRDRSEAGSSAFLAPLREATGVWFWGGRGFRLLEAYVGTTFVAELHNLLERGGVVGGTSAGAAIQPEVLLRSDAVDTDLLSPGRGFGLLAGVALDVHFLERNRIFALTGFLQQRDGLRGLGIDEDTAIIVHRSSFEVIGNSYVVVFGIEGRPEPFTFLSEGDHFDLSVWKVLGNCDAWTSGCLER